jgi:hypothetical protein
VAKPTDAPTADPALDAAPAPDAPAPDAPADPAPDAPASPDAAAPAPDVADAPDVPAPDVPDAADRPAPEADPAGVTLDYFGTPVALPALPASAPRLRRRPSEAAVRVHWEALAGDDDLAPVLDAAAQQRAALGLDDWGYVLLLRDLARSVYGGPPGPRFSNDEALFVWHALVRDGFAARVGYNRARVFLLLPSDDKLYEMARLRVDGVRHYVVTPEGTPRDFGRLRSYDGDPPGDARRFSFHVPQVPTLRPRPATRSFVFHHDGQRYAFDVTVDEAALDRLAQHPRTELAVQLSAGVSPAAEASLARALEPHLDGRTEREAVNLLLRFVQVGFGYKTDDAHFGHERYLFPEETLALPYSDCEDRAALFAYLVRRFVGLEVVGLWYPRHVSTAVRFSDEAAGEGAAIRHDGARYVIADPTYAGAAAGRLMPELRGLTPEVVVPRALVE